MKKKEWNILNEIANLSLESRGGSLKKYLPRINAEHMKDMKQKIWNRIHLFEIRKRISDVLTEVVDLDSSGFVIHPSGEFDTTDGKFHYDYFKSEVLPFLPEKETEGFPPRREWQDGLYIWTTNKGYICGHLDVGSLYLKLGSDDPKANTKTVLQFVPSDAIVTLMTKISQKHPREITVDVYDSSLDPKYFKYNESEFMSVL